MIVVCDTASTVAVRDAADVVVRILLTMKVTPVPEKRLLKVFSSFFGGRTSYAIPTPRARAQYVGQDDSQKLGMDCGLKERNLEPYLPNDSPAFFPKRPIPPRSESGRSKGVTVVNTVTRHTGTPKTIRWPTTRPDRLNRPADQVWVLEYPKTWGHKVSLLTSLLYYPERIIASHQN